MATHNIVIGLSRTISTSEILEYMHVTTWRAAYPTFDDDDWFYLRVTHNYLDSVYPAGEYAGTFN
jgi:hypothetical protein